MSLEHIWNLKCSWKRNVGRYIIHKATPHKKPHVSSCIHRREFSNQTQLELCGIYIRAGRLINPTRGAYLVTYLKLWLLLFWDHLRIGLDELRRLSLLSRHVDNGNTFIFQVFFRFPPKKSTSDHTIRDMNPGPLGPNQTPRAAQWGRMMKLGGGFAGI